MWSFWCLYLAASGGVCYYYGDHTGTDPVLLFHKVPSADFAMLDFFNKKGKYDALEQQLREQCADLEAASKYLLHKKKMVAGVIGLNLLKLCFWYGMPYLLFAGDKNINLVETMAITACLLCWLP